MMIEYKKKFKYLKINHGIRIIDRTRLIQNKLANSYIGKWYKFDNEFILESKITCDFFNKKVNPKVLFYSF
jgi:hypothetical protein